MLIFRCILPSWASIEDPTKKKVIEGEFSDEEIRLLNEEGYNIYYLPNHPSIYDPNITVDGSHVDTFNAVFIDMDLKDGVYRSKDEFLSSLESFKLPPTTIVDSGNGIHAYWSITDLDAMGFLRFQKRLIQKFKTDESIATLYQLMRYPETINTKHKEDFKLCKIIGGSGISYTSEELDALLPKISDKDDKDCVLHYNKTHNIGTTEDKIDDFIPLKFHTLLANNKEVKEIWSGNVEDRSIADFRLAHIMFASGFTREEAGSVLINAAKALSRNPKHRVSYATNILDKIWTYELSPNKDELNLSSTVKEILDRAGDSIKGTRFPCWSYLDNTEHGFRLGQVIGLVAGSGVGKTAMALNMFEGFVQSNPDYDHFFVPLEQPANEIADRWKLMCGSNTNLYEKVHIISNYDQNGAFRHLSFDEIKEYLLKFQETRGRKIGCVVIDHIGALKKKNKNGENQDLMDICHQMKAFAVHTNTLLVMQSQAPREKAGIGDLELDKDAAYGTVYFESYCDYLITIWQPLKRCYSEPKCPTAAAFKFCKIRHKSKNDLIKEDVRYKLIFDQSNGHLRELTQNEEESFKFFLNQATNKRKLDRKTDILEYTSTVGVANGTVNNHKN